MAHEDVARQRTLVNLNSSKRRVLKHNYEQSGVAGEVALGEYFGYRHVPRGDVLGGDGGIDGYLFFEGGTRAYSVDVKTTEPHGRKLLVQVDKCNADLFILAHFREGRAVLLKWEKRRVVMAAPRRQWTHLNYELDMASMRDVEELKRRFVAPCGCPGCRAGLVKQHDPAWRPEPK